MKSVFGGLASKLTMAEEWILKPLDISVEISKTEKKKKKDCKPKTEYPRTIRWLQKV